MPSGKRKRNKKETLYRSSVCVCACFSDHPTPYPPRAPHIDSKLISDGKQHTQNSTILFVIELEIIVLNYLSESPLRPFFFTCSPPRRTATGALLVHGAFSGRSLGMVCEGEAAVHKTSSFNFCYFSIRAAAARAIGSGVPFWLVRFRAKANTPSGTVVRLPLGNGVYTRWH